MIDAYLNIVAAKIGMPAHTLKVALVVGSVGGVLWECLKAWSISRLEREDRTRNQEEQLR